MPPSIATSPRAAPSSSSVLLSTINSNNNNATSRSAMTQEEKREARRQRKAEQKRLKEEQHRLQQELEQSRKLRILALHGGMSCAKKFKSGTMKRLLRDTREIADFEFVDAPYLCRCPTSYDDETGNVISYTESANDASKRTWWYWNSKDPKDDRYAPHGVHQDGMFYVGIEESLQLLHNKWANAFEEGLPYDGIFGFSQGAIVASLFHHDLMSKQKQHQQLDSQESPSVKIVPPAFMVLVSAFLKPVPLNIPSYWLPDDNAKSSKTAEALRNTYDSLLAEGSLTDSDCDIDLSSYTRENPSGYDPTDAEGPSSSLWETLHGHGVSRDVTAPYTKTKSTMDDVPTLHVYGANDTIMPSARSLALAARYNQANVYCHTNKRGHDVPNDPEGLNVITTFLKQFQ